MQTAFRAAGVSDETYYLWLDQAEAGKSPFLEFIGALKKAEAEAEMFMSRKMLQGKEHFLPAATFLERRFRDRWGRSDKHTVEANVNIRVETIDYAKLAKQMSPKKAK